jgi:hypothetical protein
VVLVDEDLEGALAGAVRVGGAPGIEGIPTLDLSDGEDLVCGHVDDFRIGVGEPADSQGQAIRSVLERSRVIHFIDLSRYSGAVAVIRDILAPMNGPGQAAPCAGLPPWQTRAVSPLCHPALPNRYRRRIRWSLVPIIAVYA